MSKPVAYCSVSARAYSQWEFNALPIKSAYDGGIMRLCECHQLPVVSEKSVIAEKLHEMIAEHNSTPEKTFYYSEQEVRELCKYANSSNIPTTETFETWWESVRKK